ncbi:CrcB family protein [Arthrobacter sp. Y81]|uniref:fluoride efflux transporter FluC n=1 Tax=Arthrobacter sp. Y81 TaxID=2058897 RepID=UPI0028006F48|nr:CrcB family protein [Arthrobacter sp. Y81]
MTAVLGYFWRCRGLAQVFHRHLVRAPHRTGTRRHWPWATLLVNVTGSLIIGLSVGFSGRLGLGEEWHAAVATGLAGGLTTFSSWTTATIRLVSEGRYPAAALNVAVNLVAGLSAAAAGIVLAG